MDKISQLNLKASVDGSTKEFEYEDPSAIHIIELNGKEYKPVNGKVRLYTDIEDLLKHQKTVTFEKIDSSADIPDKNKIPENTRLYVINEEEVEDYKENVNELYSLFFNTEENGEKVLKRITQPALKYEVEDINFNEILEKSFPKFLTFSEFENKYEEAGKTEVTIKKGNEEEKIVSGYLGQSKDVNDTYYKPCYFFAYKEDNKYIYIPSLTYKNGIYNYTKEIILELLNSSVADRNRFALLIDKF